MAADVTVNTVQPGPRLSPRLWGIFFEELNHAGDGGLYAELVRNRGLEDAATPEGWTLIQTGGGRGAMALDDARPLNGATPHSLRLEVRSRGGRVGVANSGYWGIPARKGARYVLSMFARAEAFSGPLVASLENLGVTYARAEISRLTREWKQFNCTLVSQGDDPAASLVLSANSPGTLWLDVVSLFPENTFKRRANGLRPDLAQMLYDLRPSFCRFPGGCFVEGDKLANAFRWKLTVGPIWERPGHWNLWGYRSTDGLGFHEYLQMCEDLGAEPLFVINCGMSHTDVVSLDPMQEWVQDALDAIEYANGPPDSKWGALRAAAGHPEPFNLRMIEIGNENSGPAYEERYALFYDAIKARYPEVQLIANVPVSSRPMDILDEHFYSSPDWFASQARRYDTYPRDGPKIFVGEYACTVNCGQGNLRAALGEAAFMTGIERNSDIVVMASYAPLFVNVNNRVWNPDLINFDTTRCYGTPSYYVQQMFSLNRGDVVLPTTVEADRAPAIVRGGIGVGTWATRAEFKDIRVTRGDEVLFAEDFSAGTKAWRVFKGDWAVADGVYRQSSTDVDCRSTAGDAGWADYTYSLKARKLDGAEGFLIMFGVRDDANWYWLNLGGWGNVRHGIEKCVSGGKIPVGLWPTGSIETGRWYDIRIELQGARIRCYLDGRLIIDVVDESPGPLSASATREEKTGEIILKVVNYSDREQEATIRLKGLTSVRADARAIILTASGPDAENSLDEPRRVAPVENSFRCPGPEFSYRFPSYSLSVLRLKSA
ncbi:MAG: alpha-L-arabinofuranosidase [Armatimonadetes bacterium]|nr:alpha-L-arabinofuranosidase [Armatimonadota bacterium]